MPYDETDAYAGDLDEAGSLDDVALGVGDAAYDGYEDLGITDDLGATLVRDSVGAAPASAVSSIADILADDSFPAVSDDTTMEYPYDVDDSFGPGQAVDGFDMYAGDATTGDVETLGVTDAAVQGAANGDFVDLLPQTQVIQPASSVSSMANATYSDDADSKAAVAALEQRRRKRRRKRVLIVALATVCIAGGVAAAFILGRGQGGSADESVVEPPAMAEVMRKDFTSIVTSQGALQPISSTVVRAEVDGTLENMSVSEGETVATGDTLFVVRSETLENALSAARTQLSEAQTNLAAREREVTNAYDAYNAGVAAYNAGDTTVNLDGLRTAITLAEADRTSASNAVTAANDAVNRANDDLEKCTVKSPMDGMVVAINDQSDGRTTGLSVEVADVSQLKTTIQVNEMDIALVEVGQPAKLTFSAVPDIELEGSVESVASVATNASGADVAMESGGIVTFGVTIVIPVPDPQLKTGMTATVSIMTEDVPDALVIPLTAVSIDPEDPERGTVSVVVDLSSYAIETRTVTLGARNATEVVVVDGLSEGEFVALVGDGFLPMDDTYESMEA